jgi:hypothetical protein
MSLTAGLSFPFSAHRKYPFSHRIQSLQQLREAFPVGAVPGYVILDRDGKYGATIPEQLESWGAKVVRTGYRSPWQNGVAERWVASSARTELLERVVGFNETYLRRLLSSYVAYYHEDRCHLALRKDAPEPRPVEPLLDRKWESSRSLTRSGWSVLCNMTWGASIRTPADWSQLRTPLLQKCYLCVQNKL